MPLTDMGNGCFRWGTQGKVYCGKDAKHKALMQGYAQDPKHFQQIMKSGGNSLDYALAKQIIFEELVRNEITAQTKNVKDSYDKIEENPKEAIADVKKINPKTHNIKDEDEGEENEVEEINLKTHHLEDEEAKAKEKKLLEKDPSKWTNEQIDKR